MHELLQQAKETSLGMQQLLQKIEEKDCRLEEGYEETRGYIASSFLAIEQDVNARENSLLKEVDAAEAKIVSRLAAYLDNIQEQDCLQQWIDYAFYLAAQLKQRDFSAATAYEECMAGLQNALAKVVAQSNQISEELQNSQQAFIKFTSNSTAEIERAIKSLGKFEEVAFCDQDSSEQAVYCNIQHGNCKKSTKPLPPPPNVPAPPLPYPKPPRPNGAVGASMRSSHYDMPLAQNEYDEPTTIARRSLDQAVYVKLPSYDLPTHGRLDLPCSCPLSDDACQKRQMSRRDIDICKPYMVIPHTDMQQKDCASSFYPKRICFTDTSCMMLAITGHEGNSVQCLCYSSLERSVTKVGRCSLKRPISMTYCPVKEKLLVVDDHTKKLTFIKPDSGKGSTVNLTQLTCPGGITVATGDNPNIFITDIAAKSILKFNFKGNFLVRINLCVGCQQPMGLTYSNGYLFVTDSTTNYISKLKAEVGSFEGWIGGKGSSISCLSKPYDVTALPGNRIAVTEMGNHRVSVFCSNGDFFTCFGAYGSEPGMFDTPMGISANANYIAVVDYGNRRVQIFSIGSIVREPAQNEYATPFLKTI